MDSLSAAQARRLALAAQGFARSRPAGRADRRHVKRVFGDVQLIQIDSVNVLARSQELALWARLGDHRRDSLPEMARRSELFEYWAHEASLLPIADWPLWQWQMQNPHPWKSVERIGRADVDRILAIVAERGAVAGSDLREPGRKRGTWWDWTDAKMTLEWLFYTGRVTARRRSNFEREYSLPEQIIPAAILDAPVPTEHDARKALLDRAAAALGVATERDLADYFRMKRAPCAAPLAELVADGTVRVVEVEGWKQQAYLHRDAALPRRITACTLLSPFDSLVWERQRTERLWDFHYRIEIYTPAPKRVYGYYVLPFLLGAQLVARVDLKADRKAGALLAPGIFGEAGIDRGEVSEALAKELGAMAGWLGLEQVRVGGRGDLAAPVRAALRAAR